MKMAKIIEYKQLNEQNRLISFKKKYKFLFAKMENL